MIEEEERRLVKRHPQRHDDGEVDNEADEERDDPKLMLMQCRGIKETRGLKR